MAFDSCVLIASLPSVYVLTLAVAQANLEPASLLDKPCQSLTVQDVVAALFLGVALAAYLIGSVPTGYLIGRARGVDLRALGSGNIGATNALRVLGKPAGILVLAVDALKGVLAAWGLPRIATTLVSGPTIEPLTVMAGVAVILGHNYTCWLRFKGGKGIATSAGVLVVLVPLAFFLALLCWGGVFLLSRYVSLASVSSAVALPLLVWATRCSGTMIAFSAVLAAMAIYRHRPNLKRLRNGTEHRATRLATPTKTTPPTRTDP